MTLLRSRPLPPSLPSLQFDNIYKLVGVPVITVQLRYDGWVTEMQTVRVASVVVPPVLGMLDGNSRTVAVRHAP